MTGKKATQQQILRAATQIRESALSPEETLAIETRVKERLTARSGARATSAELGPIQGCSDYQRLLPAFLDGSLAPSRALLLEEHTRHCVPCRRALKVARSGGGAEILLGQRHLGQLTRSSGGRRWLAVAAAVVAVVAASYLIWSSSSALPFGAVVESTGGGLYRAASLEALTVGSELAVGERLLSAPGESSYLRLADGSRVEVRGRSELAVEARRGTTLRVERGSIIVEAAPQGSGRLYVSTDDCLVSVKGTIFAVSHGTKGSRVAVIEGEVKVDHSGREELLYAGDRTATYARLGGSPHEEFAWSQNLDGYLDLLQEVTELRQALARELPYPGLRTSSRLLDLAPDDMAFYAAFPNLAETVSEAHRIVQERVAESPLLSEWWNSKAGGAGVGGHLELAVEMLAEVGSYLGEEIVITAALGADGEPLGPVVLAGLLDPASLRQFVENQAAVEGTGGVEVVFLEDLSPVGADSVEQNASDGARMVVWLGDDTLVAAPRSDLVRQAAERIGGSSSAGPPSGLKIQLAQAYRSGADILVAADLQRLSAAMHRAPDEQRQGLAGAGLLDAQHVIFEQKRIDGRTHNSAVLAFDGPRRGVAAWLAAPAPMGSLAYVSPDARVVAAAIITEPARVFDELLALAGQHGADGDGLQQVAGELGVDLRADVAATLGGEVTIALDGPLVPNPAWKVIAEVYDPDRLIWALQQLNEAANDERSRTGQPRREWEVSEADGRTYYTLGTEPSLVIAFDEGYLLAAPSRALIDRAVRYRRSGYTLASSPRFAQLLPAAGPENFSALFFQDAVGLFGPLAQIIGRGQLTDQQAAAFEALRGASEPTLAYAYGEESRIVFSASGLGDLLSSGLPSLLGLGLGLDGGIELELPALDGDAASSSQPLPDGATEQRNSSRRSA